MWTRYARKSTQSCTKKTKKSLNEKESCKQDSPPAAGRFSDILPLRRSAILSGAFLCHRTKFPMAQETALTMRDKSGLVGVITSTGQMEDLKCIEYSHELESTN